MAVSRSGGMVLFSGYADHQSHRIRIVMAEKDITSDIEYVDANHPRQDFLEQSPYQTLPTLVDRDLVMYSTPLIMEYLDERFPHPPLMPVDPVARARARLMLHRIEKEWEPLIETILNGTPKAKTQARKELREGLIILSPAFIQQPFFLADDFGIVDCALSPILWRLPSYEISLPASAKAMQNYADRLFLRPAFRLSLTEQERELRG
jgi:RNA polymerase-associated protein